MVNNEAKKEEIKEKRKTDSLGDFGLGLTIAGLLWSPLMFIGIILAIVHLFKTKKGDKGRKSAVIAIVLFVILFGLMIYSSIMMAQQQTIMEESAKDFVMNMPK